MNEFEYPLYESPQDYVFNMTTLNSANAKRIWREAIKTSWNNRCAYCGDPPIDDKSLTIDHVKPKARGGQDQTTNCIPACRRCNAAKGSEEWISWFKMQEFYTLEAEIRIKGWLSTGTVLLCSEEDSIWFDNFINNIPTQYPPLL